MKIFAQCLSVCVMTLASITTVSAQVQLPQFSISNIPTIELNSAMRTDNDAAFSRIDNVIMRDTMRLQYQINLLESLIRRQTEIQRIAQSYESIGIPFKQPAPPETACEQLPFNVLCMAFYPDSNKYKDLINERTEEASREQKRQMDQMMVNLNLDGFNQESLTPEQGGMTRQVREKEEPSPDMLYMWSDIQCLAGDCSALLLNKADLALRFRARVGDALPTGGKIKSISTEGVNTSFNKKTYELFAQAVGNAIQAAPPSNAIANLLTDNLGAVAQESTAMQQIVSDEAIAPQSIGGTSTGTPELLGATGLF